MSQNTPSRKPSRTSSHSDNRKSSAPKPNHADGLGASHARGYLDCPPAGLTRRLAATVYDFLILAAIWLLVGFIFMAVVLGGQPAEDPTILRVGLFPLLVLATIGFYSWFWMHGGQTLGMRAWNIKVVHARLDGTPLTFTQCFMRCFMGFFSWAIFGIGYLWVFADPSRDTWHDRFSGTRTMVVPKNWGTLKN